MVDVQATNAISPPKGEAYKHSGMKWDIRTLGDNIKEKIRLEAIAAAVPYVEDVRKAKKASDDFDAALTYKSTDADREQASALRLKAIKAEEPMLKAVTAVLKEHTLDLDLDLDEKGISEGERDKRLEHLRFRFAIMNNLISPPKNEEKDASKPAKSTAIGDAQDIKSLPKETVERIRLEVIAAASPYVDDAQKTKKALDTLRKELDKKEEIRKKLDKKKEIGAEIATAILQYHGLEELHIAAEQAEARLTTAGYTVFNKYGMDWKTGDMEFYGVGGWRTKSDLEEEITRKRNNNSFMSEIISNLISPETTKEPNPGPDQTPAANSQDKSKETTPAASKPAGKTGR